MTWLGDFRLGDTLDLKFCTVATTGAPTTLAGTPVISAYPGNSTTQLTAGITLTVDFDGVTGLHNVRVVASGGNGYATATNYALVITTGTVGGTSVVGYVIGHFSIENRSPLMPATAGRTLVVDAAGLADANTVKVGPTGAGTAQTARDVGASVLLSAGTGTGQLDFASGVVKSNLVQILATALTETAGLLAGGFKKFFNVATPTGTLNSLPGAVPGAVGGGLIAGSNADTTVNITGNITGNLSGSVGSVTGAVGSVTGLTAANLDAAISTRATQASVDAVQSSLGTISGFIDTEISTILALLNLRLATAQAATATSITLDASASAVDDFYTNCMVMILTNTGVSQTPRLITGYVGSTKVATVFPPWTTTPDATSVFAILPATQTDHVFVRAGTIASGGSNGGTLDVGASAIDDFYNDCWIMITSGTGRDQVRRIDDYIGSSKTFIVDRNWATVPSSATYLILPNNRVTVGAYPGNTPQTGDNYARLGAPAGASVSADIAAAKVDTAAIKAKTDNLPASPAAVGSAMVVSDKTGFSLSATGLDAVAAPADITSDADSRTSFVKMVRAIFNRFYNKVTQDGTNQKVYNDSANLTHTMAVSSSAGVQTKNKAA